MRREVLGFSAKPKEAASHLQELTESYNNCRSLAVISLTAGILTQNIVIFGIGGIALAGAMRNGREIIKLSKQEI